MKSKIAIYLIAALCGIGALGLGFRIVENHYLNKNLLDSTEEDTGISGLWESAYIQYEGQIYEYNKNIDTYLIMGIDRLDKMEEVEDWTQGGQSDALFFLLVDSKKKSWQLVAINRNLITELYTFDSKHNYVGRINAQICVQHGFGDGLGVSCDNTVKCASRTFFNLPINGYISLNMGAIPVLNDALGGVTVTSIEDLDVPYYDLVIKEGETVTLHGVQALGYIERRDMEGLDGATKRIERQKQFISIVYDMIRNSERNKFALVKDLIDVAQDYTYMDIPVVELAFQLLSYDQNLTEIGNIPGQDVDNGEFVDFIMDEDATLDYLISLYYQPVDKIEIPEEIEIPVISLEE